MTKTETAREDVYTRITAKIVGDLERGVRTWLKPWCVEHSAGHISRPLRANGEAYNGINVLTLWADSVAKEFACPFWMTFKQARELGGCVRKGEHGSPVVYADRMTRTDTDANGEETETAIPFLKSYTVFNCEQIEGLPAHFYAGPPASAAKIDRIDSADAFIKSTKANLVHGGNRACYVASTDNIHIPCIDFFRDSESYYATLLHELTHWTRHETRLNREFGRKRWGDKGYAAEELVAELGAAFLCADLGIVPELREDHAAYIASWLEVLKNDNRAIFTAAAYAQKAADYLQSLQPSG